MGFGNSVVNAWMELFGWTVLHSLWQITLISVLYALSIVATSRMHNARRANFRYVAGSLTLVAMAITPLVTCVWLVPTTFSNSSRRVAVVETQQAEQKVVPFSVPLLKAEANDGVAFLPVDRYPKHIFAQPINWIPIVGQFWLLGFVIASLRPVAGVARLRKLKRNQVELPELEAVAKRLARRLGIEQTIRCVGSHLTDVPLLMGWWRPVILVPMSLVSGVDPGQLECLLAHEMAHVRRHDYLVNLLQVAIETLLFFHPLTWWVSHRVRVDREYCTDDMALSVVGPRRMYVEALLELEHSRQRVSPALAASGGPLHTRVRRLIGTPERVPAVTAERLWMTMALVGGMTVAVLFVQHSFASATADNATITSNEGDEMNSEEKNTDPDDKKAMVDQFCHACRIGDIDTVSKMIAERPELVDADDDTWRPIFHAALRKQEAVVRLLIDEGADVSAHDGYVLHYAAEVPDNHAIVRMLVENGAIEAHMRPVDDLSRQLLHALYLSDSARVGKLLERHPRLATTSDGRGDPPIHHAARNGETKIVQLLIDHGADVNALNTRGHTVLYCAGGHGHVKTVELLLDNGSDLEAVFTHDGKTLEQWLAQYPDEPHLQDVAKALKTRSKDGSGRIPVKGDKSEEQAVAKPKKKELPINDDLVWAAHAGELDKVKQLIEAGADPNSREAGGMGALLNFHPQVTKYLLEQGANPDLQSNENILPVLVGVAGFNTPCVKLMLDAGADPNIASDHNGETALHHAAATSDVELVQMLLDAGANPNRRTRPGMKTYTMWRDARVRGETPLHRAAAFGSTEVIQLLLDAGADPTQRDINQDTPLSWASWHQRDKSIIDQLAYEGSGVGPDIEPNTEPKPGSANPDASAKPNASTRDAKFWEAVVVGDVSVVTRMLAEDATLANRDFRPVEKRNAHTDGFPLVRACHDGNYELAEVLLEHGADVDARSPTEEQREFGIPLFISVYDEHDRKPNYDIANLLLDHGASTDAFPWCHEPMAYWLYGAAMRAAPDLVSPMIHKGVKKYLPERDREYPTLPSNAPEEVKLFERVLNKGVELGLVSVMKHGHYDLIEEMLRHDPQQCFEQLSGAASWYGYVKVWDLVMQICPELHSFQKAKETIHAATKSHNRDGSYADYRRLIEMQLKYVQQLGRLEELRTSGDPFKAHQLLASNFCWHSNYGYKAGVSKPEHLLDLAELYLSYGFTDFNYRDPETNRTPLATAIARGTHPGMLEYAKFLIRQGADLCRDDPDDSNPMALATKIDAEKHAELRAAFIALLESSYGR